MRRLALVNLAALTVTFLLVIATRSGARPSWAAGFLLLAVCAAATIWRTRDPAGQSGREARALRSFFLAAPWVALTAVVLARGLWWTQRAPLFRLFLLHALATWSLACVIDSRRSPPEQRGSGAALVLSLVLLIIAVDGAAFGVTPFGCSASMFIALLAVAALWAATLGGARAPLKIVAVSIAIAMAVGVLEVAVRLLHLGQNVQEVDSREYAREFYSLTPPRSAFVNEPKALDEFGPALISINSRGIRGPELAEATADVLVIGDSMIEARQLPWDQTLGPRLQHAVKERGLDLRVVAHGMRGWSPLLEWNWYLKIGRTLKPRVVFLSFFWNDLWNAGDEPTTFQAKLRDDGRPLRFDVPVDARWIWYKHVRVVRLAGDAWHRLSVEQIRRAFSTMSRASTSAGRLDDEGADRLARTLTSPPASDQELRALLTQPFDRLPPDLQAIAQADFWPSLRPYALWNEAQKAAAERTATELGRFAQDVAADGGRLVIVYVPNPLQIAGDECAVGRLFSRVDRGVVLPPDSGIQTWLRDAAVRQSVDVIDPSAAMRDWEARRPATDSSRLYLRADCHWSERGHAFMASYLADWLASNARNR